MSQKQKVPRDSFVNAVKKDVKSSDPVIMVEGYVGDSSETGHFRLYSNESLNVFVDIPENDVVHVEKRNADVSPLGGSYLWLRQEAAFIYGSPETPNRPRVKFLEGNLSDAFNVGTATKLTPLSWHVTGCNNSWIAGCNSGWHTCQSHFWTDCQASFRLACPTGTIIGGGTIIVNRTSAVDACPSALACPTDVYDTIYRVGTETFGGRVNPRYANQGFRPFNPMM